MLELKHIRYEADGKEIIKDLNLTIPDGKFLVITGPNGGGKSTLARIIAGILTPQRGAILYDGQDITECGITERAKLGISFAFQQPVRFKGITVRDLIGLAAGRELLQYEVCGYLSEVGLCANDYVDREVNGSLSGGELKRIEIAMIMARGTKISLFDEPEAGIDLWSFRNLIEVFDHMHRQINGSIVIISHQERILDIADEIVVVAGGEIIRQGTKDEILPSLLAESDGVAACQCLKEAN